MTGIVLKVPLNLNQPNNQPFSLSTDISVL